MDNIQAEINKEEDDREQEEKDSGAIHVIFYPIEFFYDMIFLVNYYVDVFVHHPPAVDGNTLLQFAM